MFSFSVPTAHRALTAAVMAVFPLASIAAESATADAAPLDEVVVIAQHLNEARNGIQTQTGASTYVINEAAINAAPGGDNQLLNQVIMQAPEVA
jgi:hypothetical protein